MNKKGGKAIFLSSDESRTHFFRIYNVKTMYKS
jgi:hypothetical protein